jgi:hypothetical protein
MTTATAVRLIPVRDVARELGIVADDIERGAYDVTVHRDWANRPAVTEQDAARIRETLEDRAEADRQRHREVELQQAREAEQWASDRERRYWLTFATVVEHSDAKDPHVYTNAAATAFGVISADDPEEALRAVIRQFGEPSEDAIMYVMGRSKHTSANGKQKGKPSWLR